MNSKPAAAYAKWLDYVGYKRLLPRHAKVMMGVMDALHGRMDKRQLLRALSTWRHYAFFMAERENWERKMHKRTMEKYLKRLTNGRLVAAFRAWLSFLRAYEALQTAERHQRTVYRHTLARIRCASVGRAWKTWTKAARHLKGREHHLTSLARMSLKLVVRAAMGLWAEHVKSIRLINRVVNSITKK